MKITDVSISILNGERKNWKISKLGKLKPVIFCGRDPDGGSKSHSKSFTGYNIIQSAAIYNWYLDSEKVNKISKELYESMKSASLHKEDILLNQLGNGITFARASMISEELLPATITRSVGCIRCDNSLLDPYFLVSWLNLPSTKKYIESFSSGSSRRAIDGSKMKSFQIFMPDNTDEQNRIGIFFKKIQDRISINNKINLELESMIKTIYNYWFVQFDFPNDSGKPYKSSGGNMVWNNQLKRKIPVGWNILELNDIISRCGTGLNPRDNFKFGTGNNYYVTIRNIDQNKVILNEQCDRIDDSALKIINKRSDLQVGDTLFTSIQPVGVTYLIQEKPENWNINESVFTVRPNYDKVTFEYLFMLLSGDEIKIFTENSSAGSVHKGIRHSVLKTFKLAYKDKDIIDKFSTIIRPLLKKMDTINKENYVLEELRDFLLPMLMNGQVEVIPQIVK